MKSPSLRARLLGGLVLGALIASSPSSAARPKKRAPPPKAAVEPKAAPTPEPTAPTPTRPGDTEDAGARRGPSRIEFDDRLVKGQTNKANAIYLFERRESAMRSLLKKRTNFHDEIDEMLEDELVR